ncbi:MAG: hypothetical protein ACRDRX_25850 [Pseudonocardiaceae bacterium]
MTVTTQTVSPVGAAYVEALQHPDVCFVDPELVAGTVETTPLGLPRPRSGAASCVFSVTTRSGTRLAVKCFTRAVPDLQQRYATIAEHLAGGHVAPWQVSFDYRPRGVLVTGRWWPTVVMEWVGDGTELGRYVEDYLAEPARLGRVATAFARTCVDLRERQVAHGDLQHGNILVTADERIRLVDYDGMWVPALAGRAGIERGHPNYQPPQRRVPDTGVALDHFSSWVIYISLLATAVDATVWQRLDGGDECLLFRRLDLRDPAMSPAFTALAASESELVRAAGAYLAQLCRLASPLDAPPLDPDQLPVPADLPQRRDLPTSPPRPSQRPTIPGPVPRPRNGSVPVVRPAPPASPSLHPAPTHQSGGSTADSGGGGWGFVVLIVFMLFGNWSQADTKIANPPRETPGQVVVSPYSPWRGVYLSGGLRAYLTANGVTIETVGGDRLGQSGFSPDGHRAYVTNAGSDSVSVIHTASNLVIGTIAVGDSPEQVVVSPDGRRAYVTHTGSRTVSVIDTFGNVVTDTIVVNAR